MNLPKRIMSKKVLDVFAKYQPGKVIKQNDNIYVENVPPQDMNPKDVDLLYHSKWEWSDKKAWVYVGDLTIE